MKHWQMPFRYLLTLLLAFALTACAAPKPIPTRTMGFETGMAALGDNLAGQLEKSSLGNVLNKVIVNPLTKRGSLKKVVIDPFIDTDSGYPVKINPRINAIMSAEMAKRFAVTGQMAPENLEVSEYVLCGMVSLEELSENRGKAYKVYAAVFEKSSGVVLASAELYIDKFETAPMDIYRDSPVYLKGQNYEEHVSSVKKKPNEIVEKGYHDKLEMKSMRVKGDTLYDDKEFGKSLDYYNKAATISGSPELEILSGQFTLMVHQGRIDQAEPVYGQLLKASIAETGGIATKITFSPNAKQPLESKSKLHTVYVRQAALLLASLPECKVTIIGHSSRTGTAEYNDKLSQQRAASIQKMMASFAPGAGPRVQVIGRGFRENIVGTGADDVTDQIDRRVEFKFSSCGR